MDKVVKLTQIIKDSFHPKQSTLAVLVDFKAAYDKVWRRRMLHKLKKQAGKLFHWLQSFLSPAQHLMQVSKCSLETGLASGNSFYLSSLQHHDRRPRGSHSKGLRSFLPLLC
ncbi:hypothetical protein TNIN_95511 [Trichonephila inaurata madagascariensis]|uniref:Reverse transcriptase domain-containing protein n=1 Tax=Trichonephila inaurata madagascariensis TaxID=2747483 RepID=A0A8X6IHX1_9ARAC|nr:hypothetical protein TNIN_95511 [Trichonephila inaurata madagascariensis]